MKQLQLIMTCDNYMLEQEQQAARQIERQKARRKRIEQVEQAKLSIVLFICAVVYIILFMWLAFGY